jgi:hypothetical protein
MSEANLYEKAVRVWGTESQLRMLQEECGELIAQVNRIARGRGDMVELACEIADVEIMCAQARVIVGNIAVDRAKATKLIRLRQRLGEAASIDPPSAIVP